MLDTSYERLIKEVNRAGFITQSRFHETTGFSLGCYEKHREAGGFEGICFWIKLHPLACFLGTFLYRVWHVGRSEAISDLAIRYLQGPGPVASPPSLLINEFGMVEWPFEQYSRIFIEQQLITYLRYIHAAQRDHLNQLSCLASNLQELTQFLPSESVQMLRWAGVAFDVRLSVEGGRWSASISSDVDCRVISIDDTGRLTGAIRDAQYQSGLK